MMFYLITISLNILPVTPVLFSPPSSALLQPCLDYQSKPITCMLTELINCCVFSFVSLHFLMQAIFKIVNYAFKKLWGQNCPFQNVLGTCVHSVLSINETSDPRGFYALT